MNQSRIQLFTLVWQRMQIEKAWNQRNSLFQGKLTDTEGKGRPLHSGCSQSTVESPEFPLCFSAVLHVAHLPLHFIFCLGQVYENWESFKVNDVLEVFGVLSVDPVLSIVNSEER